nr:MAG TPA: hypothetical protein [Caudoviricetes sp.]
MNKLVQSACAGALTLALSLVGVGTASAKVFEPNSALTERSIMSIESVSKADDAAIKMLEKSVANPFSLRLDDDSLRIQELEASAVVDLPQDAAPNSNSSCLSGDATPLVFKAVSDKTSRYLVDHTRALQESSRVILSTPISSLAFDRALVYAIPVDEEVYHSVTVPITDSLPISNFTVVYAPDGQVSNYAETQVRRSDAELVHVAQWINGNKSLDKMVYGGDLDFSVSGSEDNTVSGSSDDSDQPMARSWGKAVACLAATLGVSAGTAALIMSLCGGSCAVPEPTFSKAICAACVGGLVTLGGTSIGAVVKCFGYW